MLENILRFTRELKKNNVEITTGRVIDTLKGLTFIDFSRRDDFYFTLRSNLISSVEDYNLFTKIYLEFFYGRKEFKEMEHPFPIVVPDKTKSVSLREEIEKKKDEEEDRKGNEEKEGERKTKIASYGIDKVLAAKDLTGMGQDELPAIERGIRKLTHRLATRISRRKQPFSKGKILDVRRTLRASLRYGGDPVELMMKRKKIKKTRLVTILDISGSMEIYSRFFLLFAYSLQKELKNIETFVFSMALTRITELLRSKKFDDILERLSRVSLGWSGGTDIGGALMAFNHHYASMFLRPKTIVIIVSDGWDRGDAQLLDWQMKKLKLNAYKIIWLNPLLGSPGYQPICRGMSTCIPYIDYFLPVHNLESLIYLGDHIGYLMSA